ncbi:MAG: DUF4097 domain-containing protein [Defluviitaleaceae bacterium]|nr:DUF4097 domain-containing protein [Defluviitaleaceae bacterium]
MHDDRPISNDPIHPETIAPEYRSPEPPIPKRAGHKLSWWAISLILMACGFALMTAGWMTGARGLEVLWGVTGPQFITRHAHDFHGRGAAEARYVGEGEFYEIYVTTIAADIKIVQGDGFGVLKSSLDEDMTYMGELIFEDGRIIIDTREAEMRRAIPGADIGWIGERIGHEMGRAVGRVHVEAERAVRANTEAERAIEMAMNEVERAIEMAVNEVERAIEMSLWELERAGRYSSQSADIPVPPIPRPPTPPRPPMPPIHQLDWLGLGFGPGHLDVVVQVPYGWDMANLNLSSVSGDISIVGIEWQGLYAVTISGDIYVADGTPGGFTRLDSVSGDIDMSLRVHDYYNHSLSTLSGTVNFMGNVRAHEGSSSAYLDLAVNTVSGDIGLTLMHHN